MGEDKDIRWKQRFDNYEKAIAHLELALQIQKPDVVLPVLPVYFSFNSQLRQNVFRQQRLYSLNIHRLKVIKDKLLYTSFQELAVTP